MDKRERMKTKKALRLDRPMATSGTLISHLDLELLGRVFRESLPVAKLRRCPGRSGRSRRVLPRPGRTSRA